jgi:hypothetical protein
MTLHTVRTNRQCGALCPFYVAAFCILLEVRVLKLRSWEQLGLIPKFQLTTETVRPAIEVNSF